MYTDNMQIDESRDFKEDQINYCLKEQSNGDNGKEQIGEDYGREDQKRSNGEEDEVIEREENKINEDNANNGKVGQMNKKDSWYLWLLILAPPIILAALLLNS